MKGVILAGGKGNRLKPFTKIVNKSILPIYDKPTIYFPVLSLINSGIDAIIINTNSPEQIKSVLSDEDFEADISYHVEKEVEGLAAALYDMREKIKGDPVLVMLGDIYLPFQIGLPNKSNNCCIYLSTNYDPSRISEYGVAQLGPENEVLSFEEKPKNPKGRHVHMGTTLFPEDLIMMLEQMGDIKGKNLTDIANIYHRQSRLIAEVYEGEWFNVGTPKDLFLAAQYRRQSLGNSLSS
jgi:glucose-1-phosphate thymidylyltransferase